MNTDLSKPFVFSKRGSSVLLEIYNESGLLENRLYEFITQFMNDRFIDSEQYKLRQKALVFFQGGYGRNTGWIMLEFAGEETDANNIAILDYINNNWRAHKTWAELFGEPVDWSHRSTL